MSELSRLLNPRSIAVVGASQQGGRGTRVLATLRALDFPGEVFAVHPRYQDVLGYPCRASLAELPAGVDCVVIATGADTACDVAEQAAAAGIMAAVVLASGFGEGGHGQSRAARLRALGARGMAICGPNCLGAINIKTGGAAYSGRLPLPLRAGPVALVSQSGGLATNVFTPLTVERQLGFSHIISCGNQIVTSVEDYIDYLVDDPDVTVVAVILESLRDPDKLAAAAHRAHRQDKTIIVFQAGRSRLGQVMVHSHTGALVGDAEIMAAFLHRCGIIRAAIYEEFVEAIELFAIAPRAEPVGREVVVVSGSGGGAAVAADALDGGSMVLSEFDESTRARLRASLPAFGSLTNPVDGTGAMSDDPELLKRLYDVLLDDPAQPILATSVSAWPAGNKNSRRFAATLADAARASGRTVVAYQPSPLGGPLDTEVLEALHGARVPLLLGIKTAMDVLRHLPERSEYRARAARSEPFRRPARRADAPLHGGFMAAHAALTAAGVEMVEARLAGSEDEAAAAWRAFGCPVAVKAEAAGLLHKSDIGCVQLGCDGDAAVREAYRAVVAAAARAGFAGIREVIVQPMIKGLAEVYAGVIDDPVFGPAVSFGLGGIFVEVLNDTAVEMAPISLADAHAMIDRIKGRAILRGARGRPPADVAALARLLVALGDFAVAHAGTFRSLDLNPVIVGQAGEGARAVDIAVEPVAETSNAMRSGAEREAAE